MKVEILYKVTDSTTYSNGRQTEHAETFETLKEAQDVFDRIIEPLNERANKEREKDGESSFCNSMRTGEGYVRNIHASIALCGSYTTLKLETIIKPL